MSATEGECTILAQYVHVSDNPDAITYEIRRDPDGSFSMVNVFPGEPERVHALTAKQAREVLMHGVTGYKPILTPEGEEFLKAR